MGKKIISEAAIQSKAFQWSWNTLPQTRGLICYNLNNSRNKIDGMQNRALGLIKGRADLTFYWNGRAHFLECKTEIGNQMPGQKEWQEIVESNGFAYHIFRNLEEFKSIVNRIINN